MRYNEAQLYRVLFDCVHLGLSGKIAPRLTRFCALPFSGEKQQREEILNNSCFICGLQRNAFDNKAVSFDDHINTEHNMWHYLYFIVLIQVKDPTEYTGTIILKQTRMTGKASL